MSQIVEIGGGAGLDARLHGGKSFTLDTIGRNGFRVAPGFIVDTSAFEDFLVYNNLRGIVDSWLDRIYVNGFDLQMASAEIRGAILSGSLPKELEELLLRNFDRLGSVELVVRSSSPDEDTHAHSFAGAYDSFLRVRRDDFLRSVVKVWASLFSWRSLAYRVRNQIPVESCTMAVLCQMQLPSELQGVCFTRDPLGVGRRRIEWSETANGITTGIDVTHRLLDFPIEPLGSWMSHLQRLVEFVEARGMGEDIEWAVVQGDLYVLQVRPISSGRTAANGVFRVADINKPDEVRGLPIGDCAEIHTKWWNKHGQVREVASSIGVRSTRGIILSYSEASDFGAIVEHISHRFESDYVLVDLSPKLRSMFVRVNSLDAKLHDLLMGEKEATVRIRECFVGNTYSALSYQDSEANVVVEVSSGALKGLVRGLSSSARYLVDEQGRVIQLAAEKPSDHYVFDDVAGGFIRAGGNSTKCVEPTESTIHSVVDSTRRLTAQFGHLIFEWNVVESRPILVDFSVAMTAGPSMQHSFEVFSPGVLSGRALVVGEDLKDLEYYSDGNLFSVRDMAVEPKELRALRELLIRVERTTARDRVVVVAKRPYMALSPLIGKVDAFIFDDGAILSHLGILLRESGTPAILLHGATSKLANGDLITSDESGKLVRSGSRFPPVVLD